VPRLDDAERAAVREQLGRALEADRGIEPVERRERDNGAESPVRLGAPRLERVIENLDCRKGGKLPARDRGEPGADLYA